jgi:hypothetical protein
MGLSDLKLYVFNIAAVAVSLSDTITDVLRISLLILTIVYTILKIRKLYGKGTK